MSLIPYQFKPGDTVQVLSDYPQASGLRRGDTVFILDCPDQNNIKVMAVDGQVWFIDSTCVVMVNTPKPLYPKYPMPNLSGLGGISRFTMGTDNVMPEFIVKKKTSACECGADKTYGAGNSGHSGWCPKHA